MAQPKWKSMFTELYRKFCRQLAVEPKLLKKLARKICALAQTVRILLAPRFSHYRVETRALRFSASDSSTDRQERIAGFKQLALDKASVIAYGCGGIGSEMAIGMVRKGVGNLRLFDHRQVEPSALNRQFFYKKDLGKRKGSCLARNLAPMATRRITIEGYGISFQDAVALGLDLSGSLVVCGVDDKQTMVDVSRY